MKSATKRTTRKPATPAVIPLGEHWIRQIPYNVDGERGASLQLGPRICFNGIELECDLNDMGVPPTDDRVSLQIAGAPITVVSVPVRKNAVRFEVAASELHHLATAFAALEKSVHQLGVDTGRERAGG